MNVDRVARAMTSGGPRAGFTDRVMAPIDGRPQPGFTARVVAQAFRPADTRAAQGLRVAQGFSPALTLTLALLVPAALLLAAGVISWRGSRVDLPAAPSAPRLAVGAPDLGPTDAPTLPAVRPVKSRPMVARHAPHTEPAVSLPEAPPPAIYMIAALEGPSDIAMKSIEPAACTIPALDAPAPLKVTDLPGAPGGSPQKEFKEQS